MINSQGVKWDMNIRNSLRIVLPIIIGSLNHTFFHHWFNTFQLAKCHLKPWTTAPSNRQIYQNVPNRVVYVCVITSHSVTLLLKTSTSRAIFQKILLMLQKSQTITWDASKTTMNIGRYLLLQDFFHQMAWRLLCRISVFCLRQHKGWHLRPLCEVKVQQIEKKRFHMPIWLQIYSPENKKKTMEKKKEDLKDVFSLWKISWISYDFPAWPC